MEKELNEDCTQVSNVDAGKVDIFNTVAHKVDEEDWYKQLFELRDWEE